MHASTLRVVLASGGPQGAGWIVGLAGAVILGLMLVALGTYAYKHLRGDGIEWPDESPEADDDDGDLREGGSGDEWDYY